MSGISMTCLISYIFVMLVNILSLQIGLFMQCNKIKYGCIEKKIVKGDEVE